MNWKKVFYSTQITSLSYQLNIIFWLISYIYSIFSGFFKHKEMVLSFIVINALGAVRNHLPTNSMYHIDIDIKLYIWYINTIYLQYTWNIKFLPLKKGWGPSCDCNRILFTKAYFVPTLVQIVYLEKTLLYEYRVILVNKDKKHDQPSFEGSWWFYYPVFLVIDTLQAAIGTGPHSKLKINIDYDWKLKSYICLIS